MIKVAFFGHNSNEPVVRKRAKLIQQAGIDLVGVMPHRGIHTPAFFDLIPLGETHDNKFFSRLRPLLKSMALTPKRSVALRNLDLIYARNLDMLACAHIFRWRNRLNIPIVYECLDIHYLMIGNGIIASVMRSIERSLLRRSDMLVYSSPRYIDAYFATHHSGTYYKHLVENRPNATEVGPRPTARNATKTGPLKLGWVGNIRCRRSLTILKELGAKYSPALEIVVHGYPARTIFPDFEDEITQATGVTYHGRYDSATDLAAIYGELDAVWAIDWYEAGHNSIWQIPNRIYEGGYFGVPAIALDGTETARRVADWQTGWTIAEPVEETALELVAKLLNNRKDIAQKSQTLLDLPLFHFVETAADTRTTIDMAISAYNRAAKNVN